MHSKSGHLLRVVVLIISASSGIHELDPFRNRLWRRGQGRYELVERNLNVAVRSFKEGSGDSRLDTVAMLVELFLERNQIVFVTHLCELGGAVLLLVGPAFKRRQVNSHGLLLGIV